MIGDGHPRVVTIHLEYCGCAAGAYRASIPRLEISVNGATPRDAAMLAAESAVRRGALKNPNED
jgi:hypothetical protein